MPPPGPIRVVTFDELDSTTLHARREAAAGHLGDSPICFVARSQTAGAGRLGRRWASPPGGLWMTACWPLPRERYLAVVDGLGLRVGVACRRVIAGVLRDAGSSAVAELKWPNDVLVDSRKVLGVLTEITTVGGRAWILVGVGVNVRVEPEALPPDVRDAATSLHLHVPAPPCPSRTCDALLAELDQLVVRDGLWDALLVEARAHLAAMGQRVLVSMPDGTKVPATLVGLSERGLGMFDVDGQLYVPPAGSSLVLEPTDPNP